jgi:hypothetical protein
MFARKNALIGKSNRKFSNCLAYLNLKVYYSADSQTQSDESQAKEGKTYSIFKLNFR